MRWLAPFLLMSLGVTACASHPPPPPGNELEEPATPPTHGKRAAPPPTPKPADHDALAEAFEPAPPKAPPALEHNVESAAADVVDEGAEAKKRFAEGLAQLKAHPPKERE